MEFFCLVYKILSVNSYVVRDVSEKNIDMLACSYTNILSCEKRL